MNAKNRCGILTLCAALAAPAAHAQTGGFMSGQTMDGTIVKGLPYSAETVTTVKMTLRDGTQIDRSVAARLYRDSDGRERREQTVVGLETLDPGMAASSVVIIVDPVAGYLYTLNPGSRDAHRLSLAQLWKQPPPPPPAAGAVKTESLGERVIDGEKAAGTRTTITIPVGQAGNDRAMTIVTEAWTSVDLKVVVLSRHSDPRGGDVEYRLTKIRRGEPPADLFKVPAGYTIRDLPENVFAQR
jgi:hypothetical protein